MYRLIVFLLFSLSSLHPSFAREDALTLKPGDVLSMKMARHDEMSAQFKIAIDGTAPLQFLNQVKLEGLTLQQATDKVTALYNADFFKNPIVTLTLVEAADATVQVMGAVNQPMAIVIKRGEERDIVAAIQQAGGPTATADTKNIILRREGKKPIRYRLDALQAPGASPVLLQNGDEVAVGFNQNANKTVSIIGEVTTPGAVAYPLDGNMTIERLLGEAGGLTQIGSKNGIRIVRGGREFAPNRGLRTRLLAGDVVKIPRNPNVGKFVTMAGHIVKKGKLAIGLDGRLSLSTAIANAGGPAQLGDLRKVDLKRGSQTLRYNVRDIRGGKVRDVPLQHGDTITIQERRF